MKVMTIFGTRPEGIKMAPVVSALRTEKDIQCVVVNTAQHREMLDQVMELFDLTSDYDLDMMRSNRKVEDMIGEILTKLTVIIEREKPDLVLVHGDTSTTFVGAYAAFMQQVPVGHVEAGLRTNNIYSPFPEEMNRQMVSRLATYHFAATEKNRQNLLQENIDDEFIFVIGNTVIDALLEVSNRHYVFEGELASIFDQKYKTILLTTHRRENLNDLENIYSAINRLVAEHPNVQIVFPIHKNPAIRKKVHDAFNYHERIHLIEPLDYECFVHVMKKAYLVITDSGGIQEEAPSLGKPVLVARKTTERQEGVDAGTLKLVGTAADDIYKACEELLVNQVEYKQMSGIINPFGTGETSEKLMEVIKKMYAVHQEKSGKGQRKSG